MATPRDRLSRWLRWGPPAIAGTATLALWLVVDRWWPMLPLGYGPRWPWLALPLAPLLAGGRWRDRLLPVALTAAITLWGLVGFRLPALSPGGASPTAATLRLLVFNVAVRQEAAARALDAAARWQADVIVLIECPAARLAEPDGYQLSVDGELCVLTRGTRAATITAAPRDPAIIGWSGTIAAVTIPAIGPVPIGVVHLRSVRNELGRFLDVSELLRQADSMAARHAKRVAGSRFASAWLRGLPAAPALVVGDFNLVVESPRFRQDWGHWRDAFEVVGFGTGHTWHSRWYGLRIDHVLHDARWRTTSFEIGPPMGSDHRALLVELQRSE